jgi:signal transduction histidine kinase
MDLNGELPGPCGFAAGPQPNQQPFEQELHYSVSPNSGQMDSVLLAQDEERLRLGRELHDSTGQLLVALRLGIAHLKQVHGTLQEDEALAEIEEMAGRIDSEIRSFAYANYPATIGSEGLVVALRNFVRGFALRTGLRINFSDKVPDGLDDGPEAVALLRVAQEALTNVLRHAAAEEVSVDLTRTGKGIALSVRDDGRGIAPQFENGSVSGVGLQGMRHRVERLGGRFSIRRLKQGTRLLVQLPLPA